MKSSRRFYLEANGPQGEEMSLESALVNQLRSTMVPESARNLVHREAVKGSLTLISPYPLALEPPYTPLPGIRGLLDRHDDPSPLLEDPFHLEDLVSVQLWTTPDVEADWVRAETFIKQIQSSKWRTVFEVTGNHDGIHVNIRCHKQDQPLISLGLRSQFPHCECSVKEEIEAISEDQGLWQDGAIRDYFPPPPYSHLFTSVDELRFSPFSPLIQALSEVQPPTFGIYQVVFQRVAPNHDWHTWVETLRNIEYQFKSASGLQSQYRFHEQVPSNDLRSEAIEAQSKAHNDKPFFAAALRLGVLGCDRKKARNLLQILGGFLWLFQHGGRPLAWLTEDDYNPQEHPNLFRNLFQGCLVYRPGFIINSHELVGLVHPPTFSRRDAERLPIATLDTIPETTEDLSHGLLIGYSTRAGVTTPICNPPENRFGHTGITGAMRKGKTRLMERQVLDEIEAGESGIAIIDPHGGLSERVVAQIPEKDIQRIIYFDPGDPEWIPLWNPLKVQPGQDPSLITDNFLHSFKRIVTGWGDRLEYLFRNGLLGVVNLEDGCLLDMAFALKNNHPYGNTIRQRILERVSTPFARCFWEKEIHDYNKADLFPVQHKLGKLLSCGSVASMLSQSEGRIDIPTIMKNGLIFIANLSHIGQEVRDTLGSLILALIYTAALNRSNSMTKPWVPFHVFCDEFYRFLTGSIENLLVETGKFNVSLTLAHQHFSQLHEAQIIDAMGLVATTIVFKTHHKDADQFSKIFGGCVQPRDLINLKRQEIIIRIGNDVVRAKIPTTPDSFDQEHFEAVVLESRRRWCIRREDLAIQQNDKPTLPHIKALPTVRVPDYRPEDYFYETL